MPQWSWYIWSKMLYTAIGVITCPNDHDTYDQRCCIQPSVSSHAPMIMIHMIKDAVYSHRCHHMPQWSWYIWSKMLYTAIGVITCPNDHDTYDQRCCIQPSVSSHAPMIMIHMIKDAVYSHRCHHMPQWSWYIWSKMLYTAIGVITCPNDHDTYDQRCCIHMPQWSWYIWSKMLYTAIGVITCPNDHDTYDQRCCIQPSVSSHAPMIMIHMIKDAVYSHRCHHMPQWSWYIWSKMLYTAIGVITCPNDHDTYDQRCCIQPSVSSHDPMIMIHMIKDAAMYTAPMIGVITWPNDHDTYDQRCCIQPSVSSHDPMIMIHMIKDAVYSHRCHHMTQWSWYIWSKMLYTAIGVITWPNDHDTYDQRCCIQPSVSSHAPMIMIHMIKDAVYSHRCHHMPQWSWYIWSKMLYTAIGVITCPNDHDTYDQRCCIQPSVSSHAPMIMIHMIKDAVYSHRCHHMPQWSWYIWSKMLYTAIGVITCPNDHDTYDQRCCIQPSVSSHAQWSWYIWSKMLYTAIGVITWPNDHDTYDQRCCIQPSVSSHAPMIMIHMIKDAVYSHRCLHMTKWSWYIWSKMLYTAVGVTTYP